jgi:hypothetical protein
MRPLPPEARPGAAGFRRGHSVVSVSQLLKDLHCFILGHEFYIARRMNPQARKVGCNHCKRYWVMYDPTRSFLPWDDEFEEFYSPNGFIQRALKHFKETKDSSADSDQASVPPCA